MMISSRIEKLLNPEGLMDKFILIRVLMLAFGEPGESRYVEVPLKEVCEVSKECGFDTEEFREDICNKVFYWGQNDHQSKEHCSMSVGDVVVLSNEEGLPLYYLVCGVGFKKISVQELQEYKKLEKRNRPFLSLLANS